MTRETKRPHLLSAAALAFTLTALTLTSGVNAEPSGALVAPRNTEPPTISGARRVGATLTANPGTWSGTQPITFTYQWIRCNSRMANCVNTGVTSRTYRLDEDDLGRRLLVVVTARNADGTAQAQANTGVIQRRAVAPRSTAPPTISGTPQEGQTLTANPGSWSGTQPITFTFQWQRCDANGNACATIAGATARTYVAAQADVGRSLRVAVRARNAGGARTAVSAPTEAIREGGPGGQIRLPNGKVSVPIESVALPTRLVIDEVRFAPNPVRSRTRPIIVRVHVSDTRGFVVRGALVFLRSTPLVTTTPPESATTLDGWVTLQIRARAPRPGLVFPLRRGLNVQFYVQARKAGERLLFGVTGTRLVQVRTASP